MDGILTIDEVAKIIGYKTSTFKNKMYSQDKSNLPPARKAGSKIYFLKYEVEEWMMNRPVINRIK